jgi:leucyl-tRNA synthetase
VLPCCTSHLHLPAALSTCTSSAHPLAGVKKAAPAKSKGKTAPKKKTDPLSYKSAKTKLQQKGGGAKEQWEIMRSMDVEDKDLEQFADPNHWLSYFPLLTVEDVTQLGCKVDWRRSMITTPVNPFYDSFVRWQFLKLKEKNLVRFGKRFTIWSPADNQSCMGHDRSVGENIGVQEYTLIKLEVVSPYPESLASLAQDNRKVFFAAATLRPETMYGQTNCWVLPEGEYGAYEINESEVSC